MRVRPELLEELRTKAVPVLKPYARRIVLFGSAARGEDGPDSDIDILVERRPAEEVPDFGLFKLIELQNILTEVLGRKVDLCTKLHTTVFENAKRDMVVIYEEPLPVPTGEGGQARGRDGP